MVVVSNEEDNTRSLIGEIMMAYLRHDRKVAGIVIDGPIRDIERSASGISRYMPQGQHPAAL